MMLPSNEQSQALITQLAIYTSNLNMLLEKAALSGGEIYASLDVRNQIEEQRRAINTLRSRIGLSEKIEPDILSPSTRDIIPSAPFLSPLDDFVYDAFLSYRQQEPDKNWVRKIFHRQLESAGLKVCIDYRDFRLGVPLVLEMTRAIEQSRYTLAVLSPRYVTSTFAELENILAEHLGLENSQRRLFAIMREHCQPRLGIRARLWLDMTNDDDFEEALARLVSELKQPLTN